MFITKPLSKYRARNHHREKEKHNLYRLQDTLTTPKNHNAYKIGADVPKTISEKIWKTATRKNGRPFFLVDPRIAPEVLPLQYLVVRMVHSLAPV